MFASLQEHWQLVFHLWPDIFVHTVQDKLHQCQRICILSVCEKLCAVHCQNPNAILKISLHSGLVKGWRVWTGGDTLWADKKGVKIPPWTSKKGVKVPPWKIENWEHRNSNNKTKKQKTNKEEEEVELSFLILSTLVFFATKVWNHNLALLFFLLWLNLVILSISSAHNVQASCFVCWLWYHLNGN